jgi:outer membrane protein OmpA-like peptidoglycan-associated protein
MVAAAPAPAPAPRAAQPLEFQANVLFNHNRSALADARALSMERLAVAVARARESGMQLQQVQLVGHADRTGTSAANQLLAQARAQTVRDYLVAKGVPADRIQITVQGDRQPVTTCNDGTRSRAEALECLLPNRRVEVNFVTLRAP